MINLEIYKGVQITQTKDKYYSYTAKGCIWQTKTIEELKQYIDNALLGMWTVSERQSLIIK